MSTKQFNRSNLTRYAWLSMMEIQLGPAESFAGRLA
jgi:hypothetical protein